ncbi:hypothetical protein PMALA_003420 [Plasmodium malariae]|uniref:Uncharacterized protein n=1 Tax=Plasmodium malariae TaxID=5858 RepID=A0A1A8VSN6_PLAMA|nr:hypothetical protein PMALA_003420 [Plasmodium malariae]
MTCVMFFRNSYQKEILPSEQEPHIFKFPGFWPNKFVHQISSKIKKIVNRNMNRLANFFYKNQRRFLGNTVRGPLPTNVRKNLEYAMDYFHKKAYTYHDFKQQCESLRFFVYFGLVGLLSLDLLVNPLKSSYWDQFLPMNMFRKLCRFFSNKEDNIFRHNGSSSYEEYIKLIS